MDATAFEESNAVRFRLVMGEYSPNCEPPILFGRLLRLRSSSTSLYF